MYILVTQNCKPESSHPVMEFGTAKPSSAVPARRTVKVSANIQLMRNGLIKPVDCEHGARMDQFTPELAIGLVAQVGIIVVHQYLAKRKLKC
jgi:hypothetical protein